MDGTLVDTVDLHAEAWQRAFSEFGKDLEFSVVRAQIGKSGDQLMPVFLSEKELEEIGEVTGGSVVVVPPGTRHNFLNTATEEPLRLYTGYPPPEHKDGKIDRTKQEAEHDPDEQHEE